MKLFLTISTVAIFLVALTKAASLPDNFVDGRIINGHEAKPHSAPYIVSLKMLGQHSCGGSIIDESWIITAAHCVTGGMGYISYAAAGLHKRIGLLESGVQRRTINKVYIHENYGNGVGPYDIALLHLRSPFKFDDKVQPISLPQQGKVHNGNVTLYGWGKNKANSVISLPSKLQTVTINAIPYEECKQRLPSDAPLDASNICSDSMKAGISACNGDSGGPLVEEHPDGKAELVGIVSWGYVPCGQDNLPSVYTRVSAYNDWVMKKRTEYETMTN